MEIAGKLMLQFIFNYFLC